MSRSGMTSIRKDLLQYLRVRGLRSNTEDAYGVWSKEFHAFKDLKWVVSVEVASC